MEKSCIYVRMALKKALPLSQWKNKCETITLKTTNSS